MITSLYQSLCNMETNIADRVALRWYDEEKQGVAEVHYAQYAQDLRRFVAFLRAEYGDVRGKRVAILARNSYQYVICMYGTVIAGAVAVPLNLGKDWDAISYELGLTEPVCILQDAHRLGEAQLIGDGIPVLAKVQRHSHGSGNDRAVHADHILVAVAGQDRHTLAAHVAILCTQERHEPAQILGILCVVHLGHALLFFIIPAQSHTVCNVGFHIAKGLIQRCNHFFPPFLSSDPALLCKPTQILPVISNCAQYTIRPVSMQEFCNI